MCGCKSSYTVSNPNIHQRVLEKLTVLEWRVLCKYLFAFLPEYLCNRFQSEELPSQKLKTHIILLDTAKLLFIIAVSFCIPTSSIWEHLFPHRLDQRTCCQIGKFVSLIKWNLVVVSICLLLVGKKVEKIFLRFRII